MNKTLKKKALIRYGTYALLGLLAVLLIAAIVVVVRKFRRDSEARAAEEALQEEIDNSSFYNVNEVLHLSFPVLALDGYTAEDIYEDAYEEAGDSVYSHDSGMPGTDLVAKALADEEAAEEYDPLTVSEFRGILDDLYARGYVLVDIYSLASGSDGTFEADKVMTPLGKKPLVISQYDLSYSDEADGFANSMVRNSAGQIACSYINENGEEDTGAADVVPVIEEFIAAHPDFSYKGARGILGLTGYRGVFGYQIVKDANIISTVEIEDAAAEADEHPGTGLIGGEEDQSDGAEKTASARAGKTESDAIISANKETVQAIMGSLRSSGWHIASNSYSLTSYGSAFDVMSEDVREWKDTVGPVVGTADIIIMPGGSDIGSWSGYNESDDRYRLLKNEGFRYFCVEDDESFTWAQVMPGYVRQGMHSIVSYDAYAALMNTDQGGV